MKLIAYFLALVCLLITVAASYSTPFNRSDLELLGLNTTDVWLNLTTLPETGSTGDDPCGSCVNIHGERRLFVANTECTTLEPNDYYLACTFLYCSQCVIFVGEKCRGSIKVWADTQDKAPLEVKWTRSHFCW